MAYRPRSETARRHLEALRAETVLAKMDAHEELAALWEEDAVPGLRSRFADKYRGLIGVDPERRHTLRASLEGIRDGGEGTLEDILRRHQPNRSAPAEGAPAPGN